MDHQLFNFIQTILCLGCSNTGLRPHRYIQYNISTLQTNRSLT